MQERDHPDPGSPYPGTIQFFTLVATDTDDRHAHLLVASLRAFGGVYRNCPVWVYFPGPGYVSTRLAAEFAGVEYLQLSDAQIRPRYFFSGKVAACAQAETFCDPGIRKLVWVNPYSLILQPPVSFDLEDDHLIALRPVHHRNVGLETGTPLDAYWLQIYKALGVCDPVQSVESYADRLSLRPYFNSHMFAIRPDTGLLRTWNTYFCQLVENEGFQNGACRGEAQRVFLHQAVLSALIVREFEWGQVNLLPAGYSYPLHMHKDIPPDRQAACLNELVCPVYEEIFCYPETLNQLQVFPPLADWFKEYTSRFEQLK